MNRISAALILVCLTWLAAHRADADILLDNFKGNNVVRFDNSGHFLGEVVPSAGTVLNKPAGMRLGPDGRLWVASSGNGKIVRYDNSGAMSDTFVSGKNQPVGFSFGPHGDIYVGYGLDGDGPEVGKVVEYDIATARVISILPTAITTGQAGPTFGPDGNLYVSEPEGFRIVRYSASGALLGVFVPSRTAGLDHVYNGITFGPDGHLYLGDYFNNRVLRFNGTTGQFMDVFISPGAGGLAGPQDLVFRPDGMLYVVSQKSNAVLRYKVTTGEFVDTFISGNALQSPISIVFTDATSSGTRTNAEVVIVVRDREGKEKVRIRLGPGERVEIAQEGTELPEPKRDVAPGSRSDQTKSQTNDSALALRKPSGRFTVFAPLSDKQSIDQLMEPLRKTDGFRAVDTVTALTALKPDDTGVLFVVMSDEGFKKIGKYDPGALKRQRTIGIGLGAAKLFGELGLEINWGACAEGTIGEPRLTVSENGLIALAKCPSPIFAFEPPILDSKGFHDALFFGVYIGPDKRIRRDLMDVIALQTTDTKYAAVVRQGRHILVGVDAPVDKWSPDLKRLVTELAVSLDTHPFDNSDGESGKKDGGSNQP